MRARFRQPLPQRRQRGQCACAEPCPHPTHAAAYGARSSAPPMCPHLTLYPQCPSVAPAPRAPGHCPPQDPRHKTPLSVGNTSFIPPGLRWEHPAPHRSWYHHWCCARAAAAGRGAPAPRVGEALPPDGAQGDLRGHQPWWVPHPPGGRQPGCTPGRGSPPAALQSTCPACAGRPPPPCTAQRWGPPPLRGTSGQGDREGTGVPPRPCPPTLPSSTSKSSSSQGPRSRSRSRCRG